MKYTVHKPGSGMKAGVHVRLPDALSHAYGFLPLETPGRCNPEGQYATVQEWDAACNPLRSWNHLGAHARSRGETGRGDGVLDQ